MSEATDDGGRRVTRRFALVGLVLLLGMVVTLLLWRELVGTASGGSADAELPDFPAPLELTILTDEGTGAGAPFFGERPGRRQVYASDVEAEQTCDLVRAALEAWQVDVQAAPAPSEPGEAQQTGHACALAGPRYVDSAAADIHVRAVVYPVERWEELPDAAVPDRPDDSTAPAYVWMELTSLDPAEGES